MSDEHFNVSSTVETFATIASSVVAAMAGVWRWIKARERRFHMRLSDVEHRIAVNDKRLVTLEVQRQGDTDRMERIEDTIVAIDKKLDRHTEILVDIMRGQGRRS